MVNFHLFKSQIFVLYVEKNTLILSLTQDKSGTLIVTLHIFSVL
jgi:hypothetical protein